MFRPRSKKLASGGAPGAGVGSRPAASSASASARPGAERVQDSQMPDRSGLPSGRRGGGADMSTLPSMRGTPAVGTPIHCAKADVDANAAARKTVGRIRITKHLRSALLIIIFSAFQAQVGNVYIHQNRDADTHWTRSSRRRRSCYAVPAP